MAFEPLTLLVPCYNAAEYLPRLAECVAAQTIPYAEVICYDDGSSDESAAVADSLGFRVVRGKGNLGPAAARRALLGAAQTNYLHFHDADDLIDPQFVEIMSSAVGENTAAVCAMREVGVDGRETLRAFAPEDFRDPPKLLTQQFVHHNQTVFPAQPLRESMKFADDLRLYEDVLAFFSVACRGLQFNYVAQPLTTWIRRGNSLMHRQSWLDGTIALSKYARYALPLAPPKTAPALVEYIVRKAFMNYAEDVNTFGEVRGILRWLRRNGYRGVEGMGSKERWIGAAAGPSAAFWARRRWAQLRGVIPKSER